MYSNPISNHKIYGRYEKREYNLVGKKKLKAEVNAWE